MAKYFITGISGVGKSSVVEELNRKGIKAIDLDAIEGLCQWVDGETGENVEYFSGVGREWLDRNCYNCDVEKLKVITDAEKGNIVVAGIMTNQKDFLTLFDKVFLLQCDEETLLRRLNTRDSNDFAKEAADQEHVLGYYKEFESDMIRLGAIPIGTSAPLEEVVENITLHIE